jgi:chromosome segregation ATPase
MATTSSSPSSWLSAGVLGLLLLGATSAHAEDDKRAAQLREAARRAQAAAQQAQQELSTLKAERDRLAQADEQRQRELGAAQAQSRQRSGQAAQLRAALAQAEAERDKLQAERTQEAAAREELQRQLEATQTQVQAGAQALAEQRRVTQAVTGLLERSVKSLAAAEEANRSLLSLGLQAVRAYTEATPQAYWAKGEPFFGLASVRLENEAESLRRAMAEQQVAP